MANYQHYLSITVAHHYFVNSKARGLRFEFSKATANWLERHAILSRPIDNGVCLLVDRQKADDLFDDEDDSTAIELKIFSSDPYFRNYTLGGLSHQLSTALFKLAVTESEFSQSIEPSSWLSIEEIQRLSLANKIDTLDIKELSQNLIGWLKVDITDAKAALLNGQITLNYQPNQGVWKYYLFGNEIDKNCEIIDDSGQAVFQYTGEKTLSNHRTAHTFQSNIPLIIKEKSDYIFKLRKDGQILIRRLALASASNLTKNINSDHAEVKFEIYPS